MDVLVCWEVSGRINTKMLTVVISSLWNSGWFRSLIILIFLIYFSQSSYNEYELMIWLKQQKGRKMVIFCHTNVVCKWRAQLFCTREDKLLTRAGESRLQWVPGDRMKSQYNCLELKEGKETPLASRGSHGLREDFETVRRRSPYKLTSYCIYSLCNPLAFSLSWQISLLGQWSQLACCWPISSFLVYCQILIRVQIHMARSFR